MAYVQTTNPTHSGDYDSGLGYLKESEDTIIKMADSAAAKPSSSVKLVLLGEAAVGKVSGLFLCLFG